MVELIYHRNVPCNRLPVPRNNILAEGAKPEAAISQLTLQPAVVKAYLPQVKRPMNKTSGEGTSGTGGGYNFRSSLAEYVRSQALPVDKLGHQPRLYTLTQLIGRGMVYDDDVVYAAAWLHDLGVFVGHRPQDPIELSRWDNVAYAMKQAPAALFQAGFHTTKVAQVVEAIRTHQPHLTPSTIEGMILRDADILEQLGAIGILRVAAKIGRDTRYPTLTDAAVTLRKALAELPGKLHYDTARTLAEPRIALLEAFLQELDQEAHGALY
jgi:uncharacterized protein